MRLYDPRSLRRALALVPLLLTLSCGGDGGTDPTPNPAPTITATARDTATMGTAGFALNVGGTEFMSGVVATFDGAARTTVRLNNGSLVMTLTTADLGIVGDHEIRAKNPEPGGGPSEAILFHVLPQPPVPVLDSVTPDTVVAGSPGFTLHAYGAGYTTRSKLRANGADLATTFISASHLSTNFTAGNIASSGTYSMTVYTPPLGGGQSAVKNLIITPAPPAPVITGISPDSVQVGPDTVPLLIRGQTFTGTDSVRLANLGAIRIVIPTGVTDTTVTVQLDRTWLSASDDLGVRLYAATGTSNTVFINVTNPHAVITALDPDTLDGAQAVDTVLITGTGFVAGMVIKIGDQQLPTTVLNGTTLRGIVNEGVLFMGGVHPLVVYDPVEYVTSVPFDIAIRSPVPVVDSITGTAFDTIASSEFHFLWGSDFRQGGELLVNGTPAATSWVSVAANGITFYLAPSETDTAGTLMISWRNPEPGGGASDSLPLVIVPPNPIPTLDSVTPERLPTGATGAVVTVHGRGFIPGAVAYVAQRLLEYNYSQQFPAIWIDSGTVQFTLPDTLTADAFSLSVRVRNPYPTADISSIVPLTVRSAEITATRHLDLPVSQMVGDTLHGRIYASVESYVSGSPRLVVIDPATGTVASDLPIPSPVGALAISDDGLWLVAAFPAAKLLRRYDLTTLTVDRTWNSVRGGNDTLLAPIAIAFLDGSSSTIAVATDPDWSVDGYNRMVIFDDTIPRPHYEPFLGWWGSGLAFPAESLVVQMQGTSPSPWRIFRVDSAGADSIAFVRVDGISSSLFRVLGDTLITNGGTLVDLWSGAAIGELPNGSVSLGGNGSAFTIRTRESTNPVHELRATDLSTLLEVGTPIVTTGMQVSPYNPFVRWGPGGFAWGGAAGVDFMEIDRPGW